MKPVMPAALGAAFLLATITSGMALATTGARSELLLSVQLGQSGGARAVVLGCDPDAGAHPDPKAACDRLREVDGDFDRLDVSPGVHCTEEYDPHLVRATGTWQGSPVSFERTYGNACELAAGTGEVFMF